MGGALFGPYPGGVPRRGVPTAFARPDAPAERVQLTELEVELHAVLDCRDAEPLGLIAQDLVQDYEFTITQEIGAAALAVGAEAILVPSATRLGDNLVVFPTRLQPSSRLTIVGSRDLRLYVSH